MKDVKATKLMAARGLVFLGMSLMGFGACEQSLESDQRTPEAEILGQQVKEHPKADNAASAESVAAKTPGGDIVEGAISGAGDEQDDVSSGMPATLPPQESNLEDATALPPQEEATTPTGNEKPNEQPTEAVGSLHYFSFVRSADDDPQGQKDFGKSQIQLVTDAMSTPGLGKFQMDLTLDPLVMSVESMRSKMVFYRAELKSQDTFVMYTHSHGYQLGLGAGWGDKPEKIYFPWDELADAILALPAKNVVIFTMSCHSGYLANALKAKEDLWKNQWLARGRNLVVLTAVDSDQVASATTKASAVNDIGNPFTFAVRTALRGEADYSQFGNRDGRTSYGELVDYVLATGKALSDAQSFRPQFAGEYDPNATFSLTSATPTVVNNPDASSGSGTPAPTFVLNVQGGYGSGRYRAGESIFIKSAVSPSSQVHQQWEGDVTALAQPREWLTKITMPASDLTLSAKVSPQTLSFSKKSFRGATTAVKTARYHFPEGMKGVVFFHHDQDSSSAFIEETETLSLALGLVAAGFGVVAVDAEEVPAGDLNGDKFVGWDTEISAANLDLKNLQMFLSTMITDGTLSPNLPRYSLGMGVGGSMSHALGTVSVSNVATNFPFLRFKAVSAYCSDTSATNAAKISLTPSAWYLCGGENSPTVSNSQAYTNATELKSRGIAARILRSEVTPLYPERFARVEGISLEMSRNLSMELKNAGIVDANGLFTMDAKSVAAYLSEPIRMANFPTFSQLSDPALKQAIFEQIRVVRGEHAMHSYFIQNNIQFFSENH